MDTTLQKTFSFNIILLTIKCLSQRVRWKPHACKTCDAMKNPWMGGKPPHALVRADASACKKKIYTTSD